MKKKVLKNSVFKVSTVIPVFNEEGCITLLGETVSKILENYHDYEIIFVDDGSKDQTLLKLKELRKKNNKVQYLSFSRNFGHQNALRAGIEYASGDCIITLDGDFQHPPELIPEMIEKWKDGYEIVYTVRKDDSKTSIFKRITAKMFYKSLNLISDIHIDPGAADFRLIDKKVANSLSKIKESSIFFRGMVNWLGFKQFAIDYTPNERYAGHTKYSIRKMTSLAFSGITSFSIKPLRISFLIGIIVACLSLFYGLYALFIKIFTENTIEGWTSVFFMVTFLGGVQLIMIGILGEYLGKLFIESKKRPNYIILESSLDSE